MFLYSCYIKILVLIFYNSNKNHILIKKMKIISVIFITVNINKN